MVLITGSTGFLGNHVARLAAESGERLRLLVRRDSDLEPIADLDAEVRTGDLLDASSLRDAVEDCQTVFHIAAEYALWVREPARLYAANVTGTRNLLEAAKQARAERVVYTSTVGAIAPLPDGRPVTEETPSTLAQMSGHYKRSKFLAEREARRYAANGLPVVIVNPTAPVGDGDFKPTPTGQIIQDFLAGRMPAYVDTGLNLVDVRDVARGHWLAAERGRPGERYLLGSENLTLREILARLAAISGRAAPRIRLPYSVTWMAGAASTAIARVRGGPPRIPLDGVRMARYRMFADCFKARRELGFDPAPVQAALERAVAWFEEGGGATTSESERVA